MTRKKNNLISIMLLLLFGLAITVAAKAFYAPHPSEKANTEIVSSVTAIPEKEGSVEVIIQAIEEMAKIEAPPSISAESSLPQLPNTCCPQKDDVTENAEQEEKNTPVTPVSMENTLFIGDSRTVGLSEYAQMKGANFFATVGMSVYEIDKVKVSVPDIGKVTLSELLEHQQYDRIYVMLGINELGYPFEKLVKKYGDFIQYIQSLQPDSTVFILANLHVTKSRSDSDKVINNPAIDSFNEAISEFADNEHSFYLDANCIFDDADGALSEEKSGDTAHPLAKYYQEWGSWIAAQTGAILSPPM